jgi:exodeoxyribonuclease V gamma subunit
VLLVSTGLVKDKKYRRDKLPLWWVPHLAGHLGGQALTTVLVSKVGTVTLPPLAPEAALAHWRALLAAWHAGLCRPLPLAVATGFAWLEKGGSAGAQAPEAALATARSAYEGKNGENGERQRNAYLARAYPDLDALLADGDFARLADALLRPLAQSVGDKARGADA